MADTDARMGPLLLCITMIQQADGPPRATIAIGNPEQFEEHRESIAAFLTAWGQRWTTPPEQGAT